MKKLIVLTAIAAMSIPGAAHANGLFGGKSSLLNGITSVAVGVANRDINVLNGNTVAVGNNSSILSGIGNGNSLLSGIGVLNSSSKVHKSSGGKRW
jgi:hypothetical protein